jgi:hypothetical protein
VPWLARSIPKVDAGATSEAGEGKDLAGHYEALRSVALDEGLGRAGLGAALLSSKGMAAWIRGWRACTPVPPRRGAPALARSHSDVVGLLAAMALACSEVG